MTSEEQSAIWCVTPEEPWFLALLRKLDDHIADAADIVCMPQTAQNPGLLAHSAGSLEALRTLREEIERTRAEAFQNKFRQADERHG